MKNSSIILNACLIFFIVTLLSAGYVLADFNATHISNTIPSEMYPGETRLATITFENTGSDTWTDANVRLHPVTVTWGALDVNLNSGETVTTGQTKVFTLLITAPVAEGITNCTWQMQTRPVLVYFGDQVSVPVNVNSSVTPELAADIVGHTIPSQMSPSEVRSVTVTFQNIGTATWDGSDTVYYIRLRTQNNPLTLWVTSNTNLLTTDLIAPGQQKTFTFNITAPATPAVYACRWQLQKRWPPTGTTKFFGELLDVPVQVGATGEICTDGIDNDGDTLIDCADADCDGLACNDNDACTAGETCSGSVCTGGSAVTCDDANICTDDSCDTVSGCVHTNNTLPCNDGLFCNGSDTCAGGTCSQHSGDPCIPPDLCDEENDQCTELPDGDADGVPDISDNCPLNPNGPALGTCTMGTIRGTCLGNADCGVSGFCSLNQDDSYPPGGNGIGDACECEGDFDCDRDVDGADAFQFKRDFGRSVISNPCPSCTGL